MHRSAGTMLGCLPDCPLHSLPQPGPPFKHRGRCSCRVTAPSRSHRTATALAGPHSSSQRNVASQLALTTLPETDADADAEPDTLPLTLDDASTLLLALTLAVTETLASTDALTLDVAVSLAVMELLPVVDAVAAGVCGSGAGQLAAHMFRHKGTGSHSRDADQRCTERRILHRSLQAPAVSRHTTTTPSSPAIR